MLLDGILIIAIIGLVFFISMLWPPDSPWAPFWTTPPSVARSMCKIAKVHNKTVVYDLGCGTGDAICIAAKEFGATCVGIEIDPIRFGISWCNVHMRFRVGKQVKVIRNNFFKVPLHSADVFFIYLIPNALKRLTPKFLKEAKKGALFVSYVYPFPVELFNGKLQLIQHNKQEDMYVYKML